MCMKRATWRELETARQRILAERQAVLADRSRAAQALASQLWRDAAVLESAITRMRWA